MNNSLWTTGPFKGTNWLSTYSKCCKVMTPEDSTICPELFLHDNCVLFESIKGKKRSFNAFFSKTDLAILVS